MSVPVAERSKAWQEGIFKTTFKHICKHVYIYSNIQIVSSNDNEISFNPLNAELNPICYFLALLGAHIFSTLAG